MAAPRVTLSDTDKQIKMADRALMKAAGGIEAVAALVGRSTSGVGEWQALDNARFMPHPIRLQLEDAIRELPGAPPATAYAARRCGHVMVALPQAGPTGGDLHAVLAAMVREAGEVTSHLLTALADGRVCGAEAERGQAECLHAAEELMRLHALLGEIRDMEGGQ